VIKSSTKQSLRKFQAQLFIAVLNCDAI